MRGRKSNFQFVENFDPMETINHYTEANAYQYSTFVPQDVEGLIQLMGGDKVMSISMRVMKLMTENNILIVKGSVPGPKGGYVIITK